jgi:hypothetical protein
MPNATVPKPRRTAAATSVIGADLSIIGNLESTGEVRIDGEVQGDVRASRIVVSGDATVAGALIANEIVIGGNVQGSIRGNLVTFQSASHIEATCFTGRWPSNKAPISRESRGGPTTRCRYYLPRRRQASAGATHSSKPQPIPGDLVQH